MKISLFVAVAENGVIGAKGTMPWKMSSDLKTFRRLTMGKPLIMGRKTFQSLKGPLDGRDNIVLTGDPYFEAEGISIVNSMADALTLARTLGAARGADEIMVIGGADVFRAALPRADRIYWTEIHATPEGDVYFPEIDLADWQDVSREALPHSEKDTVTATLRVIERR
ncbi:diacylglycerol kinase [Hyphomicrobium nitrativorans NL23]|uniref:Dihydrofolate reductase n=1 Tax=Hyphomicrobium nitrativorans NL23 TaxID=1029756 RepID=V5SHU6_9HYPH|nr:dihydrofolate reductase [Hyphomicrobium nitrativorans]AHB49519.1 diacylglycerol kinase [Hyphomicrobium nitrativorans NL23]